VGTTSEWIRLLKWFALFWALNFLLNLVLTAIIKRESFMKWSNVAVTALGGYLMGMMLVFEWRLLRGGIAVVFAAGFLGLIALTFAADRLERAAKFR